ncbi:SPFH domain-containing protein [Candidatus Electronema sp. PJ]|uniref:SPFH domain-containing protein n=1 Tax=Candidatus Electronema sp. PJ TaxID=3401572 RepID=UPI003AA925F3
MKSVNESPLAFIGKAVWFIVILFVFFLLNDFWFKVEPTERGNVRRFGVVQYAKPLQPGLHFKLPLIDNADKLQVSLTTVHIPPFDVTTVDNQKVTLEINFNYTIPDEKVNHVMYEIGRSGNTDIDSQVVPVVKDRTGRIFSSLNMATINLNRVTIQMDIEKDVAKTVSELFGIQPHSLQIAGITPSATFMASNEEAVKAKNAAVAAENTKKTRQFEADQLVIKAKGDADSAIEAARGRSESMLLEAQANKTRQVLEGEGLASRLAAEIKPFGTPEQYIAYLKAKAQLNWNGQQPQIVAGAGSSANLIIPVPQAQSAVLPEQQPGQ